MAQHVIEVSDLNIACSGLQLSIPSLKLEKGKLYAIYGNSASGAGDFLCLLGGLRGPLESSSPAPANTIIRRDALLPTEELRKVILQGEPVFDLNAQQRAKKIGFVFENPEWSILGGIVLEEFLYSFSAAGLPLPPWFSLKTYELFEKRFQRTETLSGGEKHRLNCASVLEYPRDLFLVDFSSSNLDRDFQRSFIGWIEQRVGQGATALVYGLNRGQLPEGTESLVCNDAELSAGDVDKEQFPELDEEKRQLKERSTRNGSGGKDLLRANKAAGEYTMSHLTCTLQEGQVIVVEGPNGCGKTTVGRMIASMKPVQTDINTPRGGHIWRIGRGRPVIAFQHPEHCFFADTVSKELRDSELLEICGINPEQYNDHPRNLNRSQQKLLSIATTLSLSTEFAILDEPTCGMDFEGKKHFVELLNRFDDLAVLVFSHDEAITEIGNSLVRFGETE